MGFLIARPQFQAKTRNVSAGGLALLSERPIPVDTTLKLWIQVAAGGEIQTLKLRGTVVRTSPYKMTGAFLYHIQLSERPKKSMQLWTSLIFENIRLFNE